VKYRGKGSWEFRYRGGRELYAASGGLIPVKGMARPVISTDGTAADRNRRMDSM